MEFDWTSIAPWIGILITGGGTAFTIVRNRDKDRETLAILLQKLQNRDNELEKEIHNGDDALKSTIQYETSMIYSGLQNLKDEITDKDHGLSAINIKVESIKDRCSVVSTDLSGRIREAEHDIRDMKGKK